MPLSEVFFLSNALLILIFNLTCSVFLFFLCNFVLVWLHELIKLNWDIKVLERAFVDKRISKNIRRVLIRDFDGYDALYVMTECDVRNV